MLISGRYIVLGKKQKGDEYMIIASYKNGEIVQRKRHTISVTKAQYEKYTTGEEILIEINIEG